MKELKQPYTKFFWKNYKVPFLFIILIAVVITAIEQVANWRHLVYIICGSVMFLLLLFSWFSWKGWWR